MYEEAIKYYNDNYIPKYKYRMHLYFMSKNVNDIKIYNSILNRIFILDKELDVIKNNIIKKYSFIILKKIEKRS